VGSHVKPKLAASTYLNSAPLVWAFSDGSQRDRCTLEPDPSPAACARLLADRSVEGALIPTIEVQRIPDVVVARGVCVAARERVRSVLLIATRPLDNIRTVALDSQSRTSVALVRILLGHFRGIQPAYAPAAPDLSAMLSAADAALLIGDPAMTVDPAGCDVYDLAELWRDATGLPFVFAVWALRAGGIPNDGPDFRAALEEGLEARDAIADRYSRLLGLDRSLVETYLSTNIHFRLDAECLAGLETFYRLAAAEGLIDTPQPLRFWPVRS